MSQPTFVTYILYSKSIKKYYVGSTNNIEERLLKHLLGTTRFTKRAEDWVVVFVQNHTDRKSALAHERNIKSMKSLKYIEDLISLQNQNEF